MLDDAAQMGQTVNRERIANSYYRCYHKILYGFRETSTTAKSIFLTSSLRYSYQVESSLPRKVTGPLFSFAHVCSGLGPAADAIVYTLRNLTIIGIFFLAEIFLHHLTSSTATTTTACAPAHCDTLSDTIGYNFQSFERLVTNSSTVYSQSFHDETQPHSQFSLESQTEPNYEANEGIIFLGCLTKAIKPSTRSTHFLLDYANSLDFRTRIYIIPCCTSAVLADIFDSSPLAC
ncbi:uncharacterized protein RSE6_05435 [Rhynchosporium secalis]|uniref:Uncharacterized protein n=1 Tax=Rhynchosporium secalis TaxID=38038 RepID=A0A1E1M7T1_RHYSE|nr:uncharacterized protein RSE6_05435 [Rhynchosporium secalis]